MFIKRIGDHDLPLPKRATDGSAGLDLQSASKQEIVIQPSERMVIPSGWGMQIPDDCVGLVWPRSGMALKYGIDVLAGCIDSDYRGEINVVLVNHGSESFAIRYGDRIAQILVMPCERTWIAEWRGDNWESQTTRGAGGFGSTGSN